ncbi:MAG TPA: hypothetical protein VN661_08865 [Candidatus Acidoferrales bacterium]|nr:hypothetical protein [Candidatus Acidoferrales bacterium]
MPFINGRYYMNPFYGRALEAARAAEENKRNLDQGGVESEAGGEPRKAPENSAEAQDDFWADVR